VAGKIIIIGAGPGGYISAVRAARLGGEVTLIERENVGGTCLNWGCIPSKVLKRSAEVFEDFKRAREFGMVVTGDVHPDMALVQSRKEKVIGDQIQGIEGLLRKHRVRLLRGRAHLEGAGLVHIRMPDGATLQESCDRLILATGSEAAVLPSCPPDGERIISSKEALSLQEIPSSLLIVGGGVIGCEFAFIFSSLGAQVTVVEALDRLLPLPSVDRDCSKVIQREMKKRRISFRLGKVVEGVEGDGDGIHATLGASPAAGLREQGAPEVLKVEKILVCTGRRPGVQGLDLERIGVTCDAQGWIITDERMETSARGIFAIGDALGPSKVMLAHVASREGMIAAENAMGGNETMDYRSVPGAIFTMPEVADVGLTESQAIEEGHEVTSHSVLFRTLGKAQVIGEIAGQIKLITEAGSGKILGVHMVGPHATDLIAEATLALRMGCTAKDLAETIHAHPTLSEIMSEASQAALGGTVQG
jgi:dihydrolipoamide dehydrogenase